MLSFLLPLLAAVGVPILLPDFSFDGGDSLAEHFRFGAAMGAAYSDAIQRRMAVKLRSLSPILGSAPGRGAYEDFLANHRFSVPKLVKELEGIALGSNVPFETVFASSISQELTYFSGIAAASEGVDHCTDYALCTGARCIGGHNEDGNFEDRELFVAYVRLGSSRFTVVNYVGDLAGGMSALAFNDAGIGFSLNWVGPHGVEMDGLGRNFVSRSLLEAQSWDEALRIATQKHACGHNYQIFDFQRKRIANIEVAHDQHIVRNITDPFFHVNQYRTLSVPKQTIAPSSAHRTLRLLSLPLPHTVGEVLHVLGDQADHLWPVFHDELSHERGELSDWTLATAIFDLDDGSISVMRGNPADMRVLRSFQVSNVRAVTPLPVMVVLT